MINWILLQMEKEFQAIGAALEKNRAKLEVINKIRAAFAPIVKKQNEKFDKLWEGYIALNYIDLNERGSTKPLERATAEDQINHEIERLNAFLKGIETEGKKDLIAPCEQCIIRLNKIIEHRWHTIIGIFRVIDKTLKDLREQRKKIDLESSQVSDAHFEVFLTKAYPILDNHLKIETDLINEGLHLIHELQTLFDLREELFKKSDCLFQK